MQRSRFLGDLLSTLFERRGLMRGKDDTRDIYELSDALLSAEGEVSGLGLASTILARYCTMSPDEKLAFFEFLNNELDIEPTALARQATDYAVAPTTETFIALSNAAEPKRQEFLRRLNQPVGATADLVGMRVDLLDRLRDNPDLQRTNHDFAHLLRSWFNRGFLVLHKINWDTSARILDKIVAYEAVHEIDDWDDLRRRLYPADRRCFAFFHPAMPDEPLIFVEVALTEAIPSSIDDLLSDTRTPLEPEHAKVAVFYSISNCQRGLKGISFGNLLIKQVVTELSQEFPQLESFVTLSPIPGLNKWLSEQVENEVVQDVLAGLAEPMDVRTLAAHYLLAARRKNGTPRDPVARFHLGNGAEVHDLHADADMSQNGRAQSSGAMVNYLYDLDQTERNHENFASDQIIAASKQVQALAAAPLSSKRKETTQ